MARRRGFDNAIEMNEHIVKEHNKVVHKKDLTYILGDITMEKDEWYFYLDQMNGRKKVILGNHDKAIHVPALLNYVEDVASTLKYRGIFVTHIPVHPQELQYRVSYNIHGHTHENNMKTSFINDKGELITKDDIGYINVSCEQVDYKPKTLDELLPGYITNRVK